MTATAQHRVATEALLGVWRRGVLGASDGRRDETSDVYWLQSLTLCGDIRRETARGENMAFSGRLSERDGVFRWERTLATPAPHGPPDEGRLSWQGDVLREDGVHDAYWETWHRVAAPAPGDFAAELFEPVEARRGHLLAMGGLVFFGVSATPGSGAAAFMLRGAGPDGAAIALSAGARGWEASLPSGPPGSVIRIAESDLQGQTCAQDWVVAALEFPFALSGRQAFWRNEP
jgi:hypothetical protein